MAAYEEPIREALLQLKFGGRAAGSRKLAEKLSHCVKDEAFDFLVPVPSPLLRRLKRGYNQAELLAKELHRQSQIPLLKALTCRFKKTQIGKRADQRRHLSADFFKVSKNHGLLKDKKILLVDDVVTTGATLCSCGQSILEAGCKSISFAAIAMAQ